MTLLFEDFLFSRTSENINFYLQLIVAIGVADAGDDDDDAGDDDDVCINKLLLTELNNSR